MVMGDTDMTIGKSADQACGSVVCASFVACLKSAWAFQGRVGGGDPTPTPPMSTRGGGPGGGPGGVPGGREGGGEGGSTVRWRQVKLSGEGVLIIKRGRSSLFLII